MSIEVGEGDWGDASTDDIRAVLQSVAQELLSHFPGRRLNPIHVTSTVRGPVLLYERGPGNRYRIQLTARDRRWGQYAYQFAHELTHILTNSEHRNVNGSATRNQWFEETLCEVASLFVLKRLAYTWEVAPPFAHWAPYSRALLQYANEILNQDHRRWPREVSPAEWLRTRESVLRTNPYLRSQNELVASLLLPMYEENPRIWEAVGYLNLEGKGADFAEYMLLWRTNAPEDHKDIIGHIATLLGAFPATSMFDDPGAVASEVNGGRPGFRPPWPEVQ